MEIIFKKFITIFFACTFCLIANKNLQAMDFKDAVNRISKHNLISMEEANSRSLKEEGAMRASTGDPMLMIAARNRPVGDWKEGETPMTGIEVSLSKKIPLTTKYGNIRDAFNSMAESKQFEANDRKQMLLKNLWEILIYKRKILEDISILEENIIWIDKILTVSKKLYANGKLSQQAILDIQIRKSELESELSIKKIDLDQLHIKQKFIVGSSEEIAPGSIPWKIFESKLEGQSVDNKLLKLERNVKAKEYALTAQKLNFIPDMTVSIGHMKMANNMMMKDDVIGASISFPLPMSAEKYASTSKAVEDKYSAIKMFENYKQEKERETDDLSKDIKKISLELEILQDKTIKYATDSREISSKSYSHGNTSYIEMLQSELKLQMLLLKRNNLQSMLDLKKVSLRYVLGEKLYE